jgi:hypothetical protein
MIRHTLIGLLLLLTAATAAQASQGAGQRAFYLTVHPRECLIGSTSSGNKSYKTVLVVPCSNPNHNLEVYAIGHGGWGHRTPPPVKTELAIMRTVCWAAYQRLTGHPLRAGWDGFAPDPGAETAQYGDKIICNYRSWPAFHALGAGWHAR